MWEVEWTDLFVLLAVVLTSSLRPVSGCLIPCNKACDSLNAVCSKVESIKAACATILAGCKTGCGQFCACTLPCSTECLKPQGACKSTLDWKCVAQQSVCKYVACPLKCLGAAFGNLSKLPGSLGKTATSLTQPLGLATGVLSTATGGLSGAGLMLGQTVGSPSAALPFSLPTAPLGSGKDTTQAAILTLANKNPLQLGNPSSQSVSSPGTTATDAGSDQEGSPAVKLPALQQSSLAAKTTKKSSLTNTAKTGKSFFG